MGKKPPGRITAFIAGRARIAALAFLVGLAYCHTTAQHEHGAPDTSAARSGAPHDSGHAVMQRGHEPEGSGTSRLPEAASAPMEMFHAGSWMLMVHGAVTLRYSSQGGPRGENAWGAPNWVMASASRETGGDGILTLRAMLSLDRLTEGGDGYPLLLQTGETWNGSPLVDRQHPHDLFSELSAKYTARISPRTSVILYAAYPGEPALGPTAFMHRPSAGFNPDAPLGHHWQDATHIAFGVATAGVESGPLGLEASIFTGREPDEERFGFDRARFDSFSARFSFNPGRVLALQASLAAIENPEGDGLDVTRTTASALYVAGEGGRSASAIVWGRNNGGGSVTQSVLVESSLQLRRIALFGRIEAAEKERHEFGIETDPDRVETVGSFALGAAYRVASPWGLDLRAGAQGTISLVPEGLEPYYGNTPLSFQVFFVLTPGFMGMRDAPVPRMDMGR